MATLLQSGEKIGNYSISSFIARGGFSCVYLAKNRVGREVALKIGDVAGGGRYVTRSFKVTAQRSPDWISPDETPTEAVFFRHNDVKIDFLDKYEIDSILSCEAKLIGHVEHANLLHLKEVIEHEGRPVLVYEYIPGKTLREILRALTGFRATWFLSLTRALQELRREGALPYHGDLKPENIIIDPSGKAVMIDPAFRRDERDFITTTPHYNPLLLENSRADMMAIGIMFYEVVTGALPFEEVPWRYAGVKLDEEVKKFDLSYFLSYIPPRTLNPNAPESLSRIIYQCLTVSSYDLPELECDLMKFLRSG